MYTVPGRVRQWFEPLRHQGCLMNAAYHELTGCLELCWYTQSILVTNHIPCFVGQFAVFLLLIVHIGWSHFVWCILLAKILLVVLPFQPRWWLCFLFRFWSCSAAKLLVVLNPLRFGGSPVQRRSWLCLTLSGSGVPVHNSFLRVR